MLIRKYTPSDCAKICKLFYETIHAINAKDYTSDQLDAWAPRDFDADALNLALIKNTAIVALEKEKIVGFGSIAKNGYLDYLFVHKDCQRKGIATKICDFLEKSGKWEKITVHASITAKPFFEKRGYAIKKRQEVQRKNVILINFAMEKSPA